MSDSGTYRQICVRSLGSKASLRRHAQRKHDASYLKRIREQHTTRPHYDEPFENPHSLSGHMVMCSENPDVEQTHARISEAHQGTTHPEAVKKQIQESMRKDLYHEVKGDERERDRAKWSAFPETLLVIRRDEIKQIRNGTYELGP